MKKAACFLVYVSCSTFALMSAEVGDFSLDSRTRYETAEQDGKADAENFSIRVRPGFTTNPMGGFQAMVEGEFTGVLDEDKYSAAGVHGNPYRAVIADPENAQLDQLWGAYHYEGHGVKVGRQVLALDGQRWVGHVGWRQNRQTFDAVTLKSTPVEGVTAFYGYVDNVVRIFGDEAPRDGANSGEFESASHLVNLSTDLNGWGALTGYGYFIELEDAPGKIAGSDTIGASYAGKCTAVDEVPMGVYLEYARQSDAGDNVQQYQANYFHAMAHAGFEGVTIEAGFERLGSDAAGLDEDGNQTFASVKSPLATLHKFNGFADVFLVTPDEGLEDRYVTLGYTWSLGDKLGPLLTKVFYHDFSSDEGGDDLGAEFDAVIAKPIPLKGVSGKLNALIKYADYDAPSGGNDLTRVVAEIGYVLSF